MNLLSRIAPAAATAMFDEPAFTQRQCDDLFAAVLVDDRIDPQTTLPDMIHLDYNQEQRTQCFRICRQLWKTGVDRDTFVSLLGKIRSQGTLGPADQLSFKHIRAKFKQLRFAYANYDKSHRYPPAFHLMTSVMGHLQDDYKNDRLAAAGRRAMLLQLLLSKPVYRFIGAEIDRVHPGSLDDFQTYVSQQIELVRMNLANPKVTGKQFHEIRKIISRQASFYVALQTLYPSPYHQDIFRSLSAINGLMGRMHDGLIERRISREQDYHADAFELPDEIRARLTAVADRYPKMV